LAKKNLQKTMENMVQIYKISFFIPKEEITNVFVYDTIKRKKKIFRKVA